MKKGQLRVQILYIPDSPMSIDDYLYYLSYHGFSPEIILPNKRTEPADMLILPDTGGFNLTSAAGLTSYPLPALFPPQHQWMEFFRVLMLEYWLNKKAKILAIGTSACVLWGAKGGKVDVDDEGKILPQGTVRDSELNGIKVGSEYTFRIGKNLWGKERFAFTGAFAADLEAFMRDGVVEETDPQETTAEIPGE